MQSAGALVRVSSLKGRRQLEPLLPLVFRTLRGFLGCRPPCHFSLGFVGWRRVVQVGPQNRSHGESGAWVTSVGLS